MYRRRYTRKPVDAVASAQVTRESNDSIQSKVLCPYMTVKELQ